MHPAIHAKPGGQDKDHLAAKLGPGGREPAGRQGRGNTTSGQPGLAADCQRRGVEEAPQADTDVRRQSTVQYQRALLHAGVHAHTRLRGEPRPWRQTPGVPGRQECGLRRRGAGDEHGQTGVLLHVRGRAVQRALQAAVRPDGRQQRAGRGDQVLLPRPGQRAADQAGGKALEVAVPAGRARRRRAGVRPEAPGLPAAAPGRGRRAPAEKRGQNDGPRGPAGPRQVAQRALHGAVPPGAGDHRRAAAAPRALAPADRAVRKPVRRRDGAREALAAGQGPAAAPPERGLLPHAGLQDVLEHGGVRAAGAADVQLFLPHRDADGAAKAGGAAAGRAGTLLRGRRRGARVPRRVGAEDAPVSRAGFAGVAAAAADGHPGGERGHGHLLCTGAERNGAEPHRVRGAVLRNRRERPVPPCDWAPKPAGDTAAVPERGATARAAGAEVAVRAAARVYAGSPYDGAAAELQCRGAGQAAAGFGYYHRIRAPPHTVRRLLRQPQQRAALR